MATRFYFPSANAPPISPAYGTAWTGNSQAVRRNLVTAKTNTPLADGAALAALGGGSAEYVLHSQYVSAKLSAQSIGTSQSITGVLRAIESNSNFNGTLALNIRRVTWDGSHVSDVLALVAPPYGTAGNELAASTNLANAATRIFRNGSSTSPVPITNVTFDAGDRLVIEIGVSETGTTTTRTANLRVGDPSPSTDITLADASTTDNCPWIEFTNTFSFQALQVPNAPTSADATDIGADRFTANWTASAEDGTHDVATGYYLEIATDSGFVTHVDLSGSGGNNYGTVHGSASGLDVGNVTSYVVTGLSSGTAYWYRLWAYNTAGNSTSSTARNPSTTSDARSGSIVGTIGPGDLAVEAKNASSASVGASGGGGLSAGTVALVGRIAQVSWISIELPAATATTISSGIGTSGGGAETDATRATSGGSVGGSAVAGQSIGLKATSGDATDATGSADLSVGVKAGTSETIGTAGGPGLSAGSTLQVGAGAAVGAAGMAGVSAGLKAGSSGTTDQAGPAALNVATLTRQGTAVGTTGGAGLSVEQLATGHSAYVSWVSFELPAALSVTASGEATGGLGAAAEVIGASQTSAAAVATAGLGSQLAGVHGTTAGLVGSIGATAVSVASFGRSAVSTAGAAAENVGSAGHSAAVATGIGAAAQNIGRLQASASSAGAQGLGGQSAGSKGGRSSSVGGAGARGLLGTAAGIAARVNWVVFDVPKASTSATGAFLAAIGAAGRSVAGAITRRGAAVGTAGAATTSTRAGQNSSVGSSGLSGQSTAVTTRTSTAQGSTGGAALTAGVRPRRIRIAWIQVSLPSPTATGMGVGSAGASGQSVGVKAGVAATDTGTAGERAVVVPAPARMTEAVATVGPAGILLGQVSGERAMQSSAGLGGTCEGTKAALADGLAGSGPAAEVTFGRTTSAAALGTLGAAAEVVASAETPNASLGTTGIVGQIEASGERASDTEASVGGWGQAEGTAYETTITHGIVAPIGAQAQCTGVKSIARPHSGTFGIAAESVEAPRASTGSIEGTIGVAVVGVSATERSEACVGTIGVAGSMTRFSLSKRNLRWRSGPPGTKWQRQPTSSRWRVGVPKV